MEENKDLLVLQSIVSTPDGEGKATKGKELEQIFNSNAAKTADNINAIWLALAECVTSKNIVALRINKDTGKSEYTYDPDDENAVWHLLSTVEWSEILGNPMHNTNLAAALNSKAGAAAFEELSALVKLMEASMETNTDNIDQNRADINSNIERLDDAERLLTDVGTEVSRAVKVPNSVIDGEGNETPVYYSMILKWNQDLNSVDFSVDGGSTWNPMTVYVEWAHLMGDPTDNIAFDTWAKKTVGDMCETADFESISVSVRAWIAALREYLLGEIDLKADLSLLQNHQQNKSNPHKVTKEQIGLGNVDDTADLDKPVSNATRELFESIEARNIGFKGMTGFTVTSTTEYESLKYSDQLVGDTIYFVSRKNESVFVESYRTAKIEIVSGGSGYTPGDELIYSVDGTDCVKVRAIGLEGTGTISEVEIVENSTMGINYAGFDVPFTGGTGTGFTANVITETV